MYWLVRVLGHVLILPAFALVAVWSAIKFFATESIYREMFQ